jgi:RHS repeat-associated protein
MKPDYLTDALGSVTATMNQSAAIVNTYRYKPYGGLLAKTGVGADPAFGWVGSQGYRQTTKKYSDVYVRARHDDTTSGRWTSKDSAPEIGQEFQRYIYANQAVTVLRDPSGLIPTYGPGCESIRADISIMCHNLQFMKDKGMADKVNACMKSSIGKKPIRCAPYTDDISWCLYRLCTGNGLTISCNDPNICRIPNVCAYASCIKMDPPPNETCTITFCIPYATTPDCNDYGGNEQQQPIPFLLVHELLHCCGVTHGTRPWGKPDLEDVPNGWQCNDILSCCIHSVLYNGDPKKCKRHTYPGFPK